MFLSKDLNNNYVYKELNFKDYLAVNLFKKTDSLTFEDYLTLLQIVSFIYSKNRNYEKILDIINKTSDKRLIQKSLKNKDILYKSLVKLENYIRREYFNFYKDLEEFTRKYLDNEQIVENIDITFKDFLKGENNYIWRLTNTRLCLVKSK